ncbi:MAG: hypothetical protein ABIS18_10190, partial [Actinomycetota bacterium]
MRNRANRAGIMMSLVLVLALVSPSYALETPISPISPIGPIRSTAEIVEQQSPSRGSQLEEIRLPDGRSLFTHGPDPRPAHGEAELMVPDATRPPVCATENYQHILYGRPFFQPSRFEEVAPTLRAVVKYMNALLNKEAIESGNVEADFKVLCDESGEIKIDEFVSTGVDYISIFDAAYQAGYNNPTVNYSMFFDSNGGAFCGVGSYSQDDRPSQNNRNNQGGGYALTYEPCWMGRAPLHENGHNMGAVQPDAPYSTGSGAHCYEHRDVMCYSPDGGDKNQT